SESRASGVAHACCGSSTILKRLITHHPETLFPAWSRDDIGPSLAVFAMIGGWLNVDSTPRPGDAALPAMGSQPPLDRWLVADFIGCSSDELDGIVTHWQIGTDPLFVRFGNSVFVSSREDAWHLLGGFISESQLKRFRDLALLVLEEDNPAFELAT